MRGQAFRAAAERGDERQAGLARPVTYLLRVLEPNGREAGIGRGLIVQQLELEYGVTLE